MRRVVPLGDPDFGRSFPCSCQDDKLSARRERFASLDLALRGYTFEAIKNRPEPEFRSAAEEVLRFAAGELEERWLVMVGSLGWAKTHMALAVLNYRIDHPDAGPVGRYVHCPEFLRQLRAGFADGSYDELLSLYQRVDLLVLDDVGAEYHRRPQGRFPGDETVDLMDWADEQVFQLLDYRYLRRMETVVTSNVAPSRLEARIRDRVLDTGTGLVRILSRDLESYRTRRTSA